MFRNQAPRGQEDETVKDDEARTVTITRQEACDIYVGLQYVIAEAANTLRLSFENDVPARTLRLEELQDLGERFAKLRER